MADTSLETSRRFASAYRLGSARSRQRTTGAEAIGPSHFPVGGVDASTVAVKIAHAILSSGARRERQRMEQDMAAREIEKSELELQRARNQVDPGYMTPYQRESLDLQRARDEAPKEAAPRATVTLRNPVGRLGPGEYDPQEVNTELRNMGIERQRAADEKRGSATKRYTAARAGQRALDEEADRLVESKMFGAGGFEEYLRAKVSDLKGGDGRKVKTAIAELGLPSNWSKIGMDSQKQLKEALDAMRKDYAGSLKSAIQRTQGPKRKQYQQSIDAEALELSKPQAAENEDPLNLEGP